MMIITVTLNPALDKLLFLERLALGEEAHAAAVREAAAGKGINVARMAQRLGGEAVAFWVCGGFTGERMRRMLRAELLPQRALRVAGEVRTNYTLVERQTVVVDRQAGAGEQAEGRATRVFEPGPELSAVESERLRAAVLRTLRSGDLLVLSGSLPPGVEAGWYATLIRLAQRKGVRSILDTRGEALREGLRARPFLVKCNAAEAAEATGVAVSDVPSALAAAERLRAAGTAGAAGPTVAVVSLGKAGAVLVAPEGRWVADSPAVREASSVGSGDCLVAALAVGLAQGWTLVESLRWGVAAGAANAAVWSPAGCSREEVERLVPQVQIREG